MRKQLYERKYVYADVTVSFQYPRLFHISILKKYQNFKLILAHDNFRHTPDKH